MSYSGKVTSNGKSGAEYGGKCECCGETISEFLTIDHTNGNGSEHRKQIGRGGKIYWWLKRNGYPKDNFRLLCYNCNLSRGHHGYCPHEKERELNKLTNSVDKTNQISLNVEKEEKTND